MEKFAKFIAEVAVLDCLRSDDGQLGQRLDSRLIGLETDHQS
jgi:hypothetical protein